MNRSFVVLALVLVLGMRGAPGIMAQEATPTTGGDLADLVLPPDAPAYGLSYEAWTARFAQWRHSLPVAIDPGADPTGERCGYGQSGPVFFLVQSGEEAAERTCTIPAGTALLLPLLDASCTTVEPPPFFGRDQAGLRACTEALFAPRAELTAVIDGVAIPDLERYRVQSEPFTVALPADNVLELEPAVLAGVIDGYWLLLAPLPPGAHELRFGGGLAGVRLFHGGHVSLDCSRAGGGRAIRRPGGSHADGLSTLVPVVGCTHAVLGSGRHYRALRDMPLIRARTDRRRVQ